MTTTINGKRCCAKCSTPYGHSATAGQCCHPVTTVEQLARLREIVRAAPGKGSGHADG